MHPSKMGHIRHKNGTKNDRWYIEIYRYGKIYSNKGRPFETREEAKRILLDIRSRVMHGESPTLVISEYKPNVNYLKNVKVGDQLGWKEEYRKRMLWAARNRAKTFNLPFNIDLEDIFIPDYCPVLRIKLEPTGYGLSNNDSSPSLDRINPILGYVKGNVAVISWKANKIKRNYTADDLRKVAEWLEYLEHCPPLLIESV